MYTGEDLFSVIVFCYGIALDPAKPYLTPLCIPSAVLDELIDTARWTLHEMNRRLPGMPESKRQGTMPRQCWEALLAAARAFIPDHQQRLDLNAWTIALHGLNYERTELVATWIDQERKLSLATEALSEEYEAKWGFDFAPFLTLYEIVAWRLLTELLRSLRREMGPGGWSDWFAKLQREAANLVPPLSLTEPGFVSG